jgi:hypothetical protein
MFLGPYPLPVVEKVYADRLATWRAAQGATKTP